MKVLTKRSNRVGSNDGAPMTSRRSGRVFLTSIAMLLSVTLAGVAVDVHSASAEQAAAPDNSCVSGSVIAQHYTISYRSSSSSNFAWSIRLRDIDDDKVNVRMRVKVNGYDTSVWYTRDNYPTDYLFHGSVSRYQRVGSSQVRTLTSGDYVELPFSVTYSSGSGAGALRGVYASCTMP